MTVCLDSAEVRVDATVAAISVGVAIVLCLIAGLLALAQDLGVNVATALHDTSRGGTAGPRTRIVRRAIVAAEIGIAFALLLSTGALYATFRNLLNVDPGFKGDNVWAVSANAPRARFRENSQIATLIDRIAQSVREIPGVEAAGVTSNIPVGGHYDDAVILADGYQMQPGESVVDPYSISVTPGYFEAMGIALKRGRYFDASDSGSAPPIIIVDEKLASKFWPDRDPVGQRMYQPDASMKAGRDTTWFRVVGVVASIRIEDLAATGGSR